VRHLAYSVEEVRNIVFLPRYYATTSCTIASRRSYYTIGPYSMCLQMEARGKRCYDGITTIRLLVILALVAPSNSLPGNTTGRVCCATSRPMPRPVWRVSTFAHYGVIPTVRWSHCRRRAARGPTFGWILL
jgi:hypothetical protein